MFFRHIFIARRFFGEKWHFQGKSSHFCPRSDFLVNLSNFASSYVNGTPSKVHKSIYWLKVRVLDYHLMYLCYSKGLYRPLYGPSNLYNTAILAKNRRFWPYTPFFGPGRNFCEKIAFVTIFLARKYFFTLKIHFQSCRNVFLTF